MNLSYLFQPRPGIFHYSKLALLAIILLFIAALAISIYRRKYTKDQILKKIIKKYPGDLCAFAVILLFLWISRESGIPFVSMRVLWIVYALAFIWWLGKKALSFKKEYKKKSASEHKKSLRSKYLPKKKKR